MKRLNYCFLTLILFINTGVFCQNIQSDWKKFEPFKTEKKTIDNLWNTAQSTHYGRIIYENGDVQIWMEYSTEPCLKDFYSRGRYTIEKDTLISSVIHLKKEIPLSEFDLNKESFKEENYPDTFTNTYSQNDGQKNIFLITIYSEGTEFVKSIFISAVREKKESFRCSKIYKKN